MKIQNSKFKIQNNGHEGQAAFIAVLFFVSIITAGGIGFTSLAIGQAKTAKTALEGKQGYFLIEAGQEDVIYRFKNGLLVGPTEALSLLGNTATTTTVQIGPKKEITSQGGLPGKVRKVRSAISTSDEVQFNYGVQVGAGGIQMNNSSSVKGNLFSAGSVRAEQDNFVYGDIISAGAAGLVDNVHATGTVRAHTIRDSFIEKDAYYQTITGTTVLGTSHPGSADVPLASLPIGDALVDEWKASAAAGGTISSPCPYKINSNATLGPVKINCDLEISGSPTVTLSGIVWVVGNIIIQNSSVIRVNPALGNVSLALIADNPANRLSSSKIELKNTVEFQGSGSPDSYVLLLSQNRSAEEGGAEKAIVMANSVQGEALVYAGHGEVELQNSIKLREVTAYKILIKNTAQIIYKTGLASTLFDSGPGGGYNILDWKEIE